MRVLQKFPDKPPPVVLKGFLFIIEVSTYSIRISSVSSQFYTANSLYEFVVTSFEVVRHTAGPFLAEM